MKKTNAARLLDRLKISYSLRTYEVDPDHLNAPSVAQKIQMPVEQVFKTLVVRGDKTGVLLACIPGGKELDMKCLAAVSGNKKVEMVHLREVQELTGYIRGGVSPLGTKKKFPVYLDQSAQSFSVIAVSAGVRGSQILLSAEELLRATEGRFAELAKK